MIKAVTIVGNLGQDQEIRNTASGVPVAGFHCRGQRTLEGEKWPEGQEEPLVSGLGLPAPGGGRRRLLRHGVQGRRPGQLQQRTWQAFSLAT